MWFLKCDKKKHERSIIRSHKYFLCVNQTNNYNNQNEYFYSKLIHTEGSHGSFFTYKKI